MVRDLRMNRAPMSFAWSTAGMSEMQAGALTDGVYEEPAAE